MFTQSQMQSESEVKVKLITEQKCCLVQNWNYIF